MGIVQKESKAPTWLLALRFEKGEERIEEEMARMKAECVKLDLGKHLLVGKLNIVDTC
jgi:hypothetical protein